MKCIFPILFLCLITPVDSHSASNGAKQNYPHTLLTDDYGILSDNDLASFTWRGTAKPFSADAAKGEYNIWQCFPREYVMVKLSDTGESSDELGWKNNVAYLEIHVLTDKYMQNINEINHKYEMRTNLSIIEYQKRFNKWLGLMNGEKYVCLAGHFVDIKKKKVMNGRTQTTYRWVFEKLKTKKGCDSYFDSCTPTYEAYLREESRGQVSTFNK